MVVLVGGGRATAIRSIHRVFGECNRAFFHLQRPIQNNQGIPTMLEGMHVHGRAVIDQSKADGEDVPVVARTTLLHGRNINGSTHTRADSKLISTVLSCPASHSGPTIIVVAVRMALATDSSMAFSLFFFIITFSSSKRARPRPMKSSFKALLYVADDSE